MSLRISFLFIFEKENSNPGCLLQYISYSMLEKFLHFKTASVILLVGASKFEYSKILRLLFFQARFTPDKIEQSPQSIKLQKKKKARNNYESCLKRKRMPIRSIPKAIKVIGQRKAFCWQRIPKFSSVGKKLLTQTSL